MGTGGVKTWAAKAFDIADSINRGWQAWDFEMGDGKNVPKLQQVSSGIFEVSWGGEVWIITIKPKETK
jgi:hypothetical protein